MADVNRGNRPLSPHISVYRPQWTSVLSILHRITGVAMTLGALMGVWWLLAAATGPEYFATVNGIVTSFIGDVIWLGTVWAISYHMLNGIRHLYWDAGFGFKLIVAEASGMAVAGGSVLLTILIVALV